MRIILKIGILTFIGTNNYGAALQAYALNRKIRAMGYDCEILRYTCENIVKREKPKKFRDVRGVKEKIVWLLTAPGQRKKYRKLNSFLDAHAVTSKMDYDRSNISFANSVYDKFVVGSDIIWETNVTGKDYSFFLDFVDESSKKKSYAASFGYDVLPDDVEATCVSLLDDFSAISVRENQGQQLLARCLPHKQTTLVCDPTLLWETEHWDSLADVEIKMKKSDYIFLYFLDSKGILLTKARELAKQYGKKIVVYGQMITPPKGTIAVYDLTPQQFLAYIKNSFFVLTGSYHGVCFSLLFRRNFAFCNRAHSSRILSLVQEMGVEDRNLADSPDMPVEMDYDAVTQKLAAFRQRSEEFLSNICAAQEGSYEHSKFAT